MAEVTWKDGMISDEGWFSMGERTLLNLAFFLALCDSLQGPIILDYPFAHLDREKAERVARVLKDISKKKQVIIVSCNDCVVAEADKLFGVSWDKKQQCSKVTVLDV